MAGKCCEESTAGGRAGWGCYTWITLRVEVAVVLPKLINWGSVNCQLVSSFFSLLPLSRSLPAVKSKTKSIVCSFLFRSSSFQMKNTMWAKFKSRFRRAGGWRKGGNKDSLGFKSVKVNEEYMEAFRTKSYIEIHSKVQGQLREKELPSPSSLSFSFSSLPFYIHFSDYLLEPCQETLANLIQTFNLHRLIVDYFQASLDACKICEILLLRIHLTRANYQIIKRVIKLTKRLQDSDHDGSGDQHRTIFTELAKFSELANPLLAADSAQFHEIHQSCKSLLPKLVSKSKKTRRKVKLHRLCKRVAGSSLIISYTAVAAAMVVLAIHSLVGIVIAPGIMAVCCVGAVRTRDRVLARRGLSLSLVENVGAQMDAAAKGVYYLVKDFDTMSRLVSRSYDEVEHIKSIVDICVRNGRRETLMKLVKEFHGLDSFLLEQLEELEDQICLCLLNINRSRMHVLQEINKGLSSNSVLIRPID